MSQATRCQGVPRATARGELPLSMGGSEKDTRMAFIQEDWKKIEEEMKIIGGS